MLVAEFDVASVENPANAEDELKVICAVVAAQIIDQRNRGAGVAGQVVPIRAGDEARLVRRRHRLRARREVNPNGGLRPDRGGTEAKKRGRQDRLQRAEPGQMNIHENLDSKETPAENVRFGEGMLHTECQNPLRRELVVKFGNASPGTGLDHRPIRPTRIWKSNNYLAADPASTTVKHRPVDSADHAKFAAEIRLILPEQR